MSKSKNERINELIYLYFKRGDKATKREFETLLLTEDGIELQNSLLTFLYDEIDNIIHEEDTTYLFQALRYIEILVEKYPDLNRKKIKKKLCKLAEKLDRLQIEHRKDFYSAKKVKQKIKKFNELILDLEIKLTKTKNKYYGLLEYFIFETRNISYLEQILKTFPKSVNVKDELGRPIFSNIVKKYIEEVNNTIPLEENENILYYKNVISLFNSRKEFELVGTDKVECLQMIYDSINRLSSKDQNYKEKCELLSELVKIIKKENERKTINNIAAYYNVKVDFEESLIEELNMYQTTYSKMVYPDRKIIDDYMVTIDGYGAIEIDDGLTAKVLPNGNYLLGVHIASVLAYLPFESNLVQEAISRGSSIYLSKNGIHNLESDQHNNIIPIFPLQFSGADASLLEGCSRLANSYFFEIDNEGNVVNQSFQKTIVKNSKKCTYQEVNQVLDNGYDADYKLYETLDTLASISYILQNKFKPSEFYKEYKSQSNDPAKMRLGDSCAEQIVNQSMILTGSILAEWLKDPSRDYPCLLRVHEIDDNCTKQLEKAMNDFMVQADKEKFDYLFDSMMGIYAKARCDLVGRHDGQNLDYYGHFTSPLRRGSDIVNEYVLDTCYFNNPTDKQLYNLEKVVIENKNIINAQNNAIEYFIDDCKYHKKLMKKNK